MWLPAAARTVRTLSNFPQILNKSLLGVTPYPQRSSRARLVPNPPPQSSGGVYLSSMGAGRARAQKGALANAAVWPVPTQLPNPVANAIPRLPGPRLNLPGLPGWPGRQLWAATGLLRAPYSLN